MFQSDMRFNQSLYSDGVVSLPGYVVSTPNAFGLEVELEGKLILPQSPEQETEIYKWWTMHNDGSLRKLKPGDQCTEYVFKKPFNLTDTGKAVDVLFDFLNRPGCVVYNSYRTSIHVHVNMAAEAFRTVYNFITLSLILDELLVSQNGTQRIGNNFCLRAKDAMGQVTNMINSIEHGNGLYSIGNQQERYSSINFTSLMKFGSVEFRSLECTTHKGRLMHWINTLNRIKEVSKQFENPTEIIARFSQLGHQEFLYMVLGPYAVKYSRVPGYEDMLHGGMRIAQDFAYCSAWNDKTTAVKQRSPTGRKKSGLVNYIPHDWQEVPQPHIDNPAATLQTLQNSGGMWTTAPVPTPQFADE